MKKQNKILLLSMLAIILVWITIVEISNLLDGGLHDTSVGSDKSNIFSNIFGPEDGMGGGAIDMDPDLSPSYALDFAFSWNSIFVFVPMMIGIVGVSLLIAHLILKRKKKPSKPYLVLIIAGFLLYFGIPSAFQGLLLVFIIIFSPHLQTLEMIVGMMYLPIVGLSFSITGILLIIKPRSVRQLYGKYF
jgi:hypothetical protein